MRDEQSTGSSEIAALAQRVETARGKLPLQHDAALFEVLSEREIGAERELAEWVRAQRRMQRRRAVEEELAAEKRDRRSAAAIRRADEADERWHRRALAARRRVSSEDARLAQLYRRAEWSSRALIAVVVLGMVWAGVNVQHNLVPSGDMTDPLYWLSYGIEAMISIPIITIMVAATTAARWGRELARGKVVFFETALLGTTIALNAGPHLASGSFGRAAEYAIAPVMVGVVIWLHAWVSARYALLIDGAPVVDRDATVVRHRVSDRDSTVGLTVDAPDDRRWLLSGVDPYAATAATRLAEASPVESVDESADRRQIDHPEPAVATADGYAVRSLSADAPDGNAPRSSTNGHAVQAVPVGNLPDPDFATEQPTHQSINGHVAVPFSAINGHPLPVELHDPRSAATVHNGRSTNGFAVQPDSPTYQDAAPESNTIESSAQSARTNGNTSPTNGHAFTNGHTVTNGHAVTDSHAATNGHPVTNGRANTNGHPVTNGHANANGHSVTNGHPVTNNDAAINGQPATSGDEVTNGRPMTNGNSVTDTTRPAPNGKPVNGIHRTTPTNGDTPQSSSHPVTNDGAVANGQPATSGDEVTNGRPMTNSDSVTDTTPSAPPNGKPGNGTNRTTPTNGGTPQSNGHPVTNDDAVTNGHPVTNGPAVTDTTQAAPTNGRPVNGINRTTSPNGDTTQSNGHAVDSGRGTSNNGHAVSNGNAMQLFPVNDVPREPADPRPATPAPDTTADAHRGDEPEEPHPGDPIRKAAATIADTVAQAISGETVSRPAPSRRKPATPDVEIEQLAFEATSEPSRPAARTEASGPPVRTEPATVVARVPAEMPVEPDFLDDEDEIDEGDEITALAHEIARRGMSNLSVEQLTQIFRLADESWLTPGIANEVGVSRAAVARAVEAGIKVRRPYAISG
ncbi:hypothetical protein [Nocardia colli]|uniref:hypothetical protein n=1 Tax=Nocardia colli TaxID=2545717 RepID=UPI0035DDCC91